MDCNSTFCVPQVSRKSTNDGNDQSLVALDIQGLSIKMCLMWQSCYVCLLTWSFSHCQWISSACWWGGCFGIDSPGGWSFGWDRCYMCRWECCCRLSGFWSLNWCFYVREIKHWSITHTENLMQFC